MRLINQYDDREEFSIILSKIYNGKYFFDFLYDIFLMVAGKERTKGVTYDYFLRYLENYEFSYRRSPLYYDEVYIFYNAPYRMWFSLSMLDDTINDFIIHYSIATDRSHTTPRHRSGTELKISNKTLQQISKISYNYNRIKKINSINDKL